MLYASGARKVVLFGVGLIGCSPSVRSANNGSCVNPGNELALGYNEGLKLVVDGFHTAVPDFLLVLTNSYDLISDMVKNPTSFGMYSWSLCNISHHHMGCCFYMYICSLAFESKWNHVLEVHKNWVSLKRFWCIIIFQWLLEHSPVNKKALWL